jgi:hypothetical protein
MVLDRCTEKIVKKIASIFKGEEEAAEKLIRDRLDQEETLRVRSLLNRESYQPLDILELLVGFTRLAAQPVKRTTPLLELLKIELRIDYNWAGKFAEPKYVFDEASLPQIFGTISRSPHQYVQ